MQSSMCLCWMYAQKIFSLKLCRASYLPSQHILTDKRSKFQLNSSLLYFSFWLCSLCPIVKKKQKLGLLNHYGIFLTFILSTIWSCIHIYFYDILGINFCIQSKLKREIIILFPKRLSKQCSLFFFFKQSFYHIILKWDFCDKIRRLNTLVCYWTICFIP